MGQLPHVKKVLLSRDLYRLLAHERSFLRRRQIRVWSGRTGDEIVAKASLENPHAILINQELPGHLKGHEVARALKRSPGLVRNCRLLIVGKRRFRGSTARSRLEGSRAYIDAADPGLLLRHLAAALTVRRRRYPRVPASIAVSSGPVMSEFLGHTRDVSLGGVLIESRSRIEPGRRLHVRLFLDDVHPPILARGVVRRCQAMPREDQFLIGVRLQVVSGPALARLRAHISRLPARQLGH